MSVACQLAVMPYVTELQALEERHQKFVSGLAASERDRVRDRLEDMDETRDRARDRLHEIDLECAKETPDRDRLREQARELARDMDQLERQYRDLGID